MSDPIAHDPNAVLDYTWDWSPWLADGETITSSTVTGPTGVTVQDETRDGTTVTAWVAADPALPTPRWARLVCHVVTSAGRADDRTLLLQVTHR